MSDTIVVTDLSKWFGLKVAVSELTIGFKPGITGLLGPDKGHVFLDGKPLWRVTARADVAPGRFFFVQLTVPALVVLRVLVLGGRSTVGHGALDAVIGVRIPASQPFASVHR